MSSLSVVIPAHNEEAALDGVLSGCMKVLPRYTDDFAVTVIDDGSTDRTAQIIEEWKQQHPAVISSIRHPERRGIAATTEEAYHAGRKEFVAVLHGDGQYPPDILLQCVPLLATCPIILMTRREKHYGRYRRVLSGLYRWTLSLLFQTDLKDPGCGKCFRRSLIGEIAVTSRGIFRDPERVIRAMKQGIPVTFISVASLPRHGGTASGARLSVIAQTALDILALWLRLSVFRQKP